MYALLSLSSSALCLVGTTYIGVACWLDRKAAHALARQRRTYRRRGQ